MRLLLTRPRPEAERTAGALRALGHEPLFAPMLDIENLRDVDVRRAVRGRRLLMTSGNAARALARASAARRLTRTVALLCRRRADRGSRARRPDFANVVSAHGDGGDLARLIGERGRPTESLPLLYLAGDDRARDMAAELAPAGLRLRDGRGLSRRGGAGIQRRSVADALRRARSMASCIIRAAAPKFLSAAHKRAGLSKRSAKLRHFCLSRRASEPLTEIGADADFHSRPPRRAGHAGTDR